MTQNIIKKDEAEKIGWEIFKFGSLDYRGCAKEKMEELRALFDENSGFYPDRNNRQISDLSGWINELGLLGRDPRINQSFVRHAFEIIYHGLMQYSATQWQPIETAPKDCCVWLGCVGSMRVCSWWQGVEYELRGSKGGGWMDIETDRGVYFTPTHWAPIPRPLGHEFKDPGAMGAYGGKS